MVQRIFLFLDTCHGWWGAADQKCPSHCCLWGGKTSNNHKGKDRKQTKINKKSTPTSFEAIFFLVAAKGFNNDRYNEKNVGWLVKHRTYIKWPPYSLHGVMSSAQHKKHAVNLECIPTGFTEPWKQWLWSRLAQTQPWWIDDEHRQWPAAPPPRLTPGWQGCWWTPTGSGGSGRAAWSPGSACYQQRCWRTAGYRHPEKWWGSCRSMPELWGR